MTETLTERFNRLTTGMNDTKIAAIMGMTEGAVRKLRRGETQSFDLERALKLCDHLGIDPWYLISGRRTFYTLHVDRDTQAIFKVLHAPGKDTLKEVDSVKSIQKDLKKIGWKVIGGPEKLPSWQPHLRAEAEGGSESLPPEIQTLVEKLVAEGIEEKVRPYINKVERLLKNEEALSSAGEPDDAGTAQEHPEGDQSA